MNPNDRDSLADLRREYFARDLRRDDMHPDPIEQLRVWFQEAVTAEIHEANAMQLSTVSQTGKPSSRIVLLKDIDADSLYFFTNYNSRKACDITVNPQVSLLFFWSGLERQVRVEGMATQTSRDISEAYFQTRPRGSQIGAWASPQSSELPDRATLEANQAAATDRFGDGEISCPPFWGGYRVIPNYFEFWQGGRDRLHDRLVYRPTDEAWEIVRLSS